MADEKKYKAAEKALATRAGQHIESKSRLAENEWARSVVKRHGSEFKDISTNPETQIKLSNKILAAGSLKRIKQEGTARKYPLEKAFLEDPKRYQSPEAAEFKRFSKRGVRVKPTKEPRPGTKVGLHYSSNLESLIGSKLENRKLGFSIGRNPNEILSSPTSSEPKGTKGVALVKIQGKGLDATRPDDRLLLHKLSSKADKERSSAWKKGIKLGGIDTLVIQKLKNMGVDYVENWSGLVAKKEGDPELHVINQEKIKVLKTVKAGLKHGKGLAARLGKLKKGVLGLGTVTVGAYNAGMKAYEGE